MTTHAAIIDCFGGPHALAAALEQVGCIVKQVTVRAWALRGRIPSRYWADVVRASERLALGVSLEMLAAAERQGAEDQPAGDRTPGRVSLFERMRGRVAGAAVEGERA